MSSGSQPGGGINPEQIVPHYELSGFNATGGNSGIAVGSIMGMMYSWLQTEIQSMLKELVGITGDMSQVVVIIEDLDYLMEMLNNLDDPSFVVPSNYGEEMIDQINKCIAAVNALQGSPGSGINQVKSELISDLDDVKELFEVCPFAAAFESLATNMKGLLNCLYECMHDSSSYFGNNQGAIASAFETYYWAVNTDIDNLNTLCNDLQSQYGSVPTAITTLDNACNTFWSDLNGIEVSGTGFHNENTSLYDEMHGKGPIGDPISWYLDDLNKACNGDKHYSESGAATAYNQGEVVVNTDIPAAENSTLPPNELVDVLHEALTTPLGQNTLFEQETQTLMDAYYQATSSTQQALDIVYQSVSTNMIIAVSSLLDMMKALMMFAKKEAESGMNVIRGDIQQIRKIQK